VTPTYRLGLAQDGLRFLTRAQAHLLHARHRVDIRGELGRHRAGRRRDVCDDELLERVRRGERGGHRGLAAHRVPEKLHAREAVGGEEGEDVGGHGGVGVRGGCGRVPVVAEVERVHGPREVVGEGLAERVPVTLRAPGPSEDGAVERSGKQGRTGGHGGRRGRRRWCSRSGQRRRRRRARRASRRASMRPKHIFLACAGQRLGEDERAGMLLDATGAALRSAGRVPKERGSRASMVRLVTQV
jgi:hypothetical protein